MDSTELDELESGLTSGFWQRVSQHVEREWGPAGERYQQAIAQAIASGKDADDAVHALRMMVFAQKEIARLLKWPEERVAAIRSRIHPLDEWDKINPSRRGRGL